MGTGFVREHDVMGATPKCRQLFNLRGFKTALFLFDHRRQVMFLTSVSGSKRTVLSVPYQWARTGFTSGGGANSVQNGIPAKIRA